MERYKFGDIVVNSTAKKKPVESDKDTYLGLENLDSECLMVKRFGADVAPKGEKLLMKKGDILFGKRRAYQRKVAIAPFDGIFSAHGMVLRPNTDFLTWSFIPFFISSDYFLDAAIKISVGSLSPTINWKDLKELEFDLPSKEEQERLATILWKIEENIRACDIAKSKTTEYKERLFESLLNKETTISGTNPSKWQAKRWDELFYEYVEKTTVLDQYEVLSSTVNGLYTQSEYFNKEVASAQNIGYKVVRMGQAVFSPQNLWLGNINLNDKYEIGMVSPSYKVYSLNEELLDIEFAKYMIKSTKAIKEYVLASEQGASIVRRNLNMDLFNAIEFNIPPIDEQVVIVDLLKKLEEEEAALQVEFDGLHDLSKSILYECFGGKANV